MNREIETLNSRIKELEKENLILKQQQIDINKAKELYLKIFEEFPALIWRSRLDKLCDYFNKTWLEFTGRTMEQEFGNGWAEGVHPDDFDFCLQTYVTAFDKKEPFLMEYRMKNKFGEYRWIRDFGRPFFDLDNSFLGYIGSCYDITEIKDNEFRLIELNATKDKFFSIIAHDLKSPLGSIIGLSERLIEKVKGKEYAKIEKFANLILESSNGVSNLLTNLMVWAQSQTGKLVFNPVQFDIVPLVLEVTQLLKEVAFQKSIIIENNLPSHVPIIADKEMISTVLRNLISNALKFTKEGGLISISAEYRPNYLVVIVADNGVGITKDRIDKIFEISENNSTPGTHSEKGTGLGLILCKEFMEKINGKIWVESVDGQGTSFFLSIPIH
jgi:PAS domain S-box-containing protein